jgi:hypothetical protein
MPAGYDFAIFGSGPLSALLAGLLAHDHGKQVIRIAAPVSPLRLPRSIDLALPFATRPASWRIVRRAEAETRAVLTSLAAPEAIIPVDVRIVADRPATAMALAHMTHLALGDGMSVRDNLFARVSRLTGEIDLHDSKAQSIDAADVALNFTRAGVASLTIAGEAAEVGQIVLAEDAAILDLMPESQRPASLAVHAMTATLTAPARRLAAPIMSYPDRGVVLAQRPDLSIHALVSGERDVEARLASCLDGPFPLTRVATTRYRRITTLDGAPLIGRLKPSKLFVIAGLGDAAAFLAPPLARLLNGVPRDDERTWFLAHDPARTNRAAIADFAGAAA